MRIAAFNGFPFHYEVFGYIINWCKQRNYHLSLYTETSNDFGWFEWYKNRFGALHIEPIAEFEYKCHNYHIIFVLTDDDDKFRDSWLKLFNLQSTVVSIDHHILDRRPQITKHLAIRNYAHKPHAYPVYPLKLEYVYPNEKINLFTSGIHIYI